MKTYARGYSDCPEMQKARLQLSGIGLYYFETSLFDKPYEVNMNMPYFKTESEAYKWIDSEIKENGSKKWHIIEE